MNLKCKINGVEYGSEHLEQGATFTENYNETLDSAVIHIVHIEKIKKLKPYHDVFIYDANYSFLGYHINGQTNPSGGFFDNTEIKFLRVSDNKLIYKRETYDENTKTVSIGYYDSDDNEIEGLSIFFKHMLIHNISCRQLRIGQPIYNYELDLFSEIKALEKVILPNISITANFKQPKSCWFYLQQYVKLYSPKFKMAVNTVDKIWAYEQKYRLDPSLEAIFDSTTCPEMSWTNPSLRDVLSQIMIVKDRIPYVENNVIKAIDITATHGRFLVNNPSCGFVYDGISSDNYATDARREYGGAISDSNSARLVEHLGFRLPNNAIMSFENMVLETRYPIYKINRLLMCYYKKIRVSHNGVNQEKIILCKQDITKLVLQNIVRNVLKTDWKTFNGGGRVPDIEVLCQYKMATIGYDIGSNQISGWGTIYSYPTILWFNEEKSYIENIINILDAHYPFGYLNQSFYIPSDYTYIGSVSGVDSIVTPYGGASGNDTDKFKAIFFEMDYIAMFNGAIVHSKDNIEEDDIVTADNCNAALTILEADGLFEKEKMNRLSNEDYQLPTRYEGENGYDLMNGPDRNHVLGAVIPELENSIVYRREYTIMNQEVKGSFSACYDYVMKNYFTSIWAKYRTYSLMPYSQSIVRSENVRELILLSKDEFYFESTEINFDIGKMLTAFEETPIIDDYISYEEKINTAKFTIRDVTIYDDEAEANSSGSPSTKVVDLYLLSDLNAFVSGTSLCLNARTYDNVSGGMYIDDLHKIISNPITEQDEEIGTIQNWWPMVSVDDFDNAFLENVSLSFSHVNIDELFHDCELLDTVQNQVFNYTYKLPNQTYLGTETNLISKDFNICKDNKEVLDMTYQFDFLAKDNDGIVITPYLNKLNNLIITKEYVKADEDKTVLDRTIGYGFQLFAWTHSPWDSKRGLGLVIKIEKNLLSSITSDMQIVLSEEPVLHYSGEIFESTGVYAEDHNKDLQVHVTSTMSISSIQGIGNRGMTLTLKTKVLFEPAKDSNTSVYSYENAVLVSPSLNFAQIHLDEYFNGDGYGDYYYFKYTGNPTPDITEIAFLQSPAFTSVDTRRIGPGKITSSGSGDNILSQWGFLAGNSNPLKLNLNNSFVTNGSLLTTTEDDKNFFKNMYVAVSTKSLQKYLVQDDFAFPENSDILNENITLLKDAYVSNFFVNTIEGNKPVLQVHAERLKEFGYEEGEIKALLYYFKDENSHLHLVFGVNVDSYKIFNIYISVMKQRNMKVFDSEHNYADLSSNYLGTTPREFDSEQHYGDGANVGVYYKLEGSSTVSGRITSFKENETEKIEKIRGWY